MQPAVAVILVTLSNQGHWFGGRDGHVSLQWAAEAPMPESTIAWDLVFSQTVLVRRELALRAGGEPSRIDVMLPPVRARTQLTWRYRVQRADDGQLLTSGEAVIHAYPGDLLAPAAARLITTPPTVLDDPSGLPATLEDAGVAHRRIDNVTELNFAPADVILVGPHRLGTHPASHAALLAQAQRGAGVLIFEQHAANVAGAPLIRRAATDRLVWRMEHPLLWGLNESDLSALLAARGNSHAADVWAVRLSGQTPTTAVVHWPRESLRLWRTTDDPLDALLAVRWQGEGRLVFCQLPLGPWTDDPRSQVLLASALDYLLSPVPPAAGAGSDKVIDAAPVAAP